MRDAAALVPPLSWLAVWNRQLIRAKSGDADDEQEEHGDGEEQQQEREIDELHRSGVIYGRIYQREPGQEADTAHSDAGHERDLLARRIGLAQGLVDFTRSFAKGPSKRNASVEDEDNAIPDKVDPDKEIKVVQSQNQRLVFLQPEPDYWIVAAFDRYLPHLGSSTPKGNNHVSNPSAAQKKAQGTQPQARLHPSSFLPNETFTDLLKRAYAEFRLFNGTFGQVLLEQGQEKLQANVTSFFDAWKDEARLLPLGIPKAPPSTAHQFLQPPTGCSIVAISHSGILPTTASPSTTGDMLTRADRLALACHLANLLPSPKPVASTIASTSNGKGRKEKDKKVKRQASFSTSTWKSLHLGGISSYLPSMPGMSGTPSSSTSQVHDASKPTPNVPKTQALSQQTASTNAKTTAGKRTSSGSAWIPTFGLFGASGGVGSSSKGKDANDSKAPVQPILAIPPDTPLNETQTTILHSSEVARRSLEGESGEPPDSAASEASLEALSEAIMENIAAESIISANASQPDAVDAEETVGNGGGQENGPVSNLQSKFRAIWSTPQPIYISTGSAAAKCYLLHNDDIAVALVYALGASDHSKREAAIVNKDDKLDKIAADQYFTHLATLQAYPPPSATPQLGASRSFSSFNGADCMDITELEIDDRASASNASLRQRYNLAINAKTDTDKLLSPNVKQLFVRTYFSQWLVAERNANNENVMNKLTILPKSIGKEGSLLDADAEMQRLAEGK